MMLTKLTLTIDKSVIEQAKHYARKKQRSVSKIVEDYLRNVSKNTDLTDHDMIKTAPITDSLAAMFQNEYQGQEYDDLLEEALLEKHL
jgi:DNA-directed RNA polymerase beta' subunit